MRRSDPASIAFLAARTSATPAHLSNAVRRLERRGFVEGFPCATDGRVTKARLTDRIPNPPSRAVHDAGDRIGGIGTVGSARLALPACPTHADLARGLREALPERAAEMGDVTEADAFADLEDRQIGRGE